MALYYILRSGMIIPQALFFSLRIVLVIWDILWFHKNFRIAFSIFVKSDEGILISIPLDLQIAFTKMVIFTMLILPIHEDGMSFYFLCLSLSLSSEG